MAQPVPVSPPDTVMLLALRARIVAWEASAFGDPLVAYRDGLMGQYLNGLRGLLGGEPATEQAVLMAALALGPRDSGLPGAGDLGPLLRLTAQAPDHVLDLTVAWGCGWGHRIWPDHAWHARWTAAVLALAWMVRGSINRTLTWLADNVHGFRDRLRLGGDGEQRERIEGASELIALELATGSCRCGHGDLSSHSLDGACARREHRLEHWQPDKCRLHAFVASAVRGSARLPVKAGAFSVSMLVGHLEAEHLLRTGTVEFRVCHNCNSDIIAMAAESRRRIRLSSITQGLYDVGRCTSCERPPHPDKTYRIGRKNWLLVPAEWGGQYQPIHRHRCMACGNLFEHGRADCPICGWRVRPPARLTTVWVRDGYRPSA